MNSLKNFLNTSPIKSTTQFFIEISEIDDGLVYLKNGTACLILQVFAINFALLSEQEQEAMIQAYGSLLNSLSFPIQIVIRSKKKDISTYLKVLKIQEEKTKDRQILLQLRKYQEFVAETVKRNEVLDKKFYIVLSFSPLEMGTAAASLFFKKTLSAFSHKYLSQKARMSLYPKRDHLIRQLARIGLKSLELKTADLIALFYDIFNTDSSIVPFNEPGFFETPIVSSAVAIVKTAKTPIIPSKEELLKKGIQGEITPNPGRLR